jgi:hypothetical protein
MRGLAIVATVFGLVIGFQASAKQIIKGDSAHQLYNDMVSLQMKNPGEFVSYTNGFFGDAERPQLGKLWLTTIYPKATHDTFCYEYDFRESNVKEYLCELYNERAI